MHHVLEFYHKREGYGVEIVTNKDRLVLTCDNADDLLETLYAFKSFSTNQEQGVIEPKKESPTKLNISHKLLQGP